MVDYTLGHFLRGVVQFTARYQPSESSPEARASSPGEASDAEIDAGAEKDFLLVLEHAPKVEVCPPNSYRISHGIDINLPPIVDVKREELSSSWIIISSITVISNLGNCMLLGVTM